FIRNCWMPTGPSRLSRQSLELHNLRYKIQFAIVEVWRRPEPKKGVSIMANSDSGLAEILKAVPQGAESVFPKAEYDRRIGQLQRLIAEKGFDLVLMSGPENVFYLTGQQ